MEAEIYIRVIISFFKILWLKLKYGSRIKMHPIQSFGKNAKIKIQKRGFISIGKETISRDNLILMAQNAELNIGNKCFFNANVSITAMEKITIGDGCQIANNVVIVDHDHDYRNGLDKFVTASVSIGKNVWIGANCTILKGTHIGDNCVIAAGTTVRGNIEDNSLVYEKKELMIKEKISR